ncbi:uncharacterized protein LOC126845443, partial [Adelges cooleyi]
MNEEQQSELANKLNMLVQHSGWRYMDDVKIAVTYRGEIINPISEILEAISLKRKPVDEFNVLDRHEEIWTVLSFDILLGGDVAPTILTGTRVAGHPSEPTAFGTIFGWILMGPISQTSIKPATSLLVTTTETLEQSLTRFWEMEEAPKVHHLSPEEVQAETIFTSSIQRLASGRFSVAIPFKHPRPLLGDSKCGALRRFHALDRRLSQDSNLGSQYADFMRDYLESKHMEVVPASNKITPYCYYIPHHCILRPESQTTKLRVVFDASARTTTGQSLNSS